ncbi:MAG: filamentous hemagglutinin N-terminal domain-containing protein, partial [Rhizobium sp.]
MHREPLLPTETTELTSLADLGRRSMFARAIAATLAVTLWVGPVHVTLMQASQAAGTLAAGAMEAEALAVHAGALRQRLMQWAMSYVPVAIDLRFPSAQAAPVIDPAAPIRFTPALGVTTGPGAPPGGVPVVGITTPNAQGISLNQYRSFVVDPIGLILNNSTTGGGSFLGGRVEANASLAASGPARLIVNQVTSSAPAQINGAVEIFGAPAGLVVAAPGGVFVNGAGFTNTTQVTLTTGTPQWLTGGGTPTSFDAAAAAGFLVEGGRIQIANPTPGQGGATGIEGTVGNINLIAESIGIDAALNAGNEINLIAGRQRVMQAASGLGGFATAATSANDAATNTSTANGLAIDATAFGAMNAGQIKIVSTAAGLGVRADGNLAASAGNLTLDAAGNVKVGNTYAKQAVAIHANGNVLAAGNGQGEAGYAVSAGKDVMLDGTLASGKAVNVAAGGAILGAGGVKAQEAVTLSAAGSVDVGGTVSGASILVQAAGQDGVGDIHLRGDIAAPGTIALQAARDTTIDGSAVSAGELNLSSQRNLTVNGAAGSTTGNVSLSAVTGNVTTAGNVVSPGTLTVTAGTDVMLGGQVVAAGKLAVTAQTGSISTSGQIGSNADIALAAARNVTVGGQAQSGGNTLVTAAAGDVAIRGALTSDGHTAIGAGGDVDVAGGLASDGDTAVVSLNGSATLGGSITTVGNASLEAARDITISGSTLVGGGLAANAGRTLDVKALTWIGQNATLRGNDIRLSAAAAQSNAVTGTLDASAANSLALSGNTTASNVRLDGATVSNQGATVATQQMTVTGGTLSNTDSLAGATVQLNVSSVTNRGTIGGQNTTLTAGSVDNAHGLIVGTNALAVTTDALLSNQGGTLFAGDLTGARPTIGNLGLAILGGGGSFNNAGGQLLAGNDLTINAPNQVFDPSAGTTGNLNANGTLTLGALAIDNTGTWTVPGGKVVLNASQGITNSGTIQKAGDLSLATGGALTNTGQIIGGANVSLSSSNLTNTGTLHANGTLALDGNVVNRGVTEALGNIAITGGNYDNAGAKTQANGDVKVDIGGTLNNTGGVIGANGNFHIAAGTVLNDRTGPVDAGSTTTKATNDSLLNSTVIGSYQPWVGGDCENCSGPTPGNPVDIRIGDLTRNSDGTSISPVSGVAPYSAGGEDGLHWVPMWHVGTDATAGTLPSGAPIVALPTVDRTVVKQADGTAGQIVSGGNLDVTASLLSNKGGIISAARDVVLSVAVLDNSRSATLTNSVTDVVNQTELSAFLAQLKAIGATDDRGFVTGYNQLMFGNPPPVCQGDACGAPGYTASPMTVGTRADGAPVTAPVQSSVTSILGKAGQITSGGNLALNGSGDLTNAGDIAAAGKVTITTPGTFTNQGLHESHVTSTPGCVPGGDCPDDSNPHVDSVAWQQTPSTIAAGNTLTINAGNVANLHATLASQGNVTINAGGTVTNQAGAIQSISGDVAITATALVNKSLDPAKIQKSYGGQNPGYAGGCNPGGTYGNSQCMAIEDAANGPAAVISGARDVTFNGGTVGNHGGLISGGRNVSIQASGGVDNTAIALNADWQGRWQEKRSGGDRWHDTAGRSAIGNIASAIQAGGSLSVNSGGQIVNTGNILGTTVDLTGVSLVNGYTAPTQPTPPSAPPRQVIPLGPVATPAGEVPAATPAQNPNADTPWQFQPVIVATPAAPTTGSTPTVDWHFNANPGGTPLIAPTATTDRAQYVSPNPATGVLAGVTPDSLLAQLPADLRPGNVAFYYDPYTESQKLQQAALMQTGQESFISGLSWDAQNNLSVSDQEKLSLYKNAADYARDNHIKLGQALTDDQVMALDAPMLWYVEQAVPDPRCSTVSSVVCPTVNALVPQVYLPEGYAQAMATPTGGTISGRDISVTVDGQLRNSGQVVATDTLAVKAGSLDLSPNVVDIGTNAYKASGGWNVITGTVVQPGGYLSAMHMDIEADSIRAINDALRITRADGTVDEHASAALVSQLKQSLGLSYEEGSLQDDLHTQFIKEKKGFGVLGQIVAMVAAVAISIVTAGAGAALMGVALAEMTAMQAMLAVAIDAAIAGTLSSMVAQVITTGSLNIGAALKAGAVAAVTAGLTQGALAGLNVDKAGVSSFGDNIAKGNWSAASSNIGSYAEATVVRSAISAGVNTAVYGGSFGQAFAGGLVKDAAAVAANGIGGSEHTPEGSLSNVLSHALLGCAAQSLGGGDCAGGAIGGAASAIAAPLIRDGVYADSRVVNYSDDPVRQAVTVGFATLIGGSAGLLLGGNSTSAALAAQNEALNNATSGAKKPTIPDDVRKMMEAERRAFGQTGTVPNTGGSDRPWSCPCTSG